ncbi:MAG: AIPR family protein [Sulfuriferula sp.]|nr:AIPR family protein [Sulfuriferula sp.]
MNTKLFIDSYLEKINSRFGFNPANGFAFEIFAMAAILDQPFDEVYSDISTLIKSTNGEHSGNHDGGIDGVFFDELTATLAIFQTKNTEYLRDNEIAKFINDYQNLFERMNSAQLPLNPKISAKLENILAITRAGTVYTPKLFFVFNGHKQAQNKDIADRYCQQYPILEILGAGDLFAKIEHLQASQRKRKTVKFTFNAEKSNIASSHDPQALMTYAKGNVRSVGFRLKAKELCRLIEEEVKVNGDDDHLYSQNVRGFLGAVRTNKQIEKTLLGQDAAYFPFMNNGITMIAETLKLPNAMQALIYPIEVTNPVIVNGLQSTQVIYKVYKSQPDKLEDVDIMVRLYDTQDEELAEKITTATNTQTSINTSDKISNRNFNHYLKILFENKGIGYIVKRGDSFENKLSKALKDTVTSETLLKFWYATYLERPEIAKASKATVFQQLYDASSEPSDPLHTYFGGDPQSPLYTQMLNVYQLHHFVVTQRNDSNESTPDLIQHADEILCYGIYKNLVASTRITTDIDASILNEAYTTVFTQLESICANQKSELTRHGRTYSHNNYFKSAQSRIDLNREAGWIECGLLDFDLLSTGMN